MESNDIATSEAAVSGPAAAEIESLARETCMPVEVVQEVYASERVKIERMARIKTYVPVLIRRHVKALLRERRTAS